MKRLNVNLLTALFLNLSCFSLEAEIQNFSSLNSGMSLNSEEKVPDFFFKEEVKKKAHNKKKQLKHAQKSFSEFILFLSITLPTLNDRHASLSIMQNIGKRFTKPLLENMRKYEHSTNPHNKQLLQKFKNTANRLITNEARGLILNDLNRPRLKKQIKADFSTLLDIWNRHIHSINTNHIKKNFNGILSINNTFNRNRFNYNGAIYKRLNNFIDEILNEIQD